MSRHIIDLHIAHHPKITLIMGFDRKLKEFFFNLEQNDEVIAGSLIGDDFTESLREMANNDDRVLQKLADHLESAMHAVDVEQMTLDDDYLLGYTSQALSSGKSHDEVIAIMGEVKAFKAAGDYNRIVKYPDFVDDGSPTIKQKNSPSL